MGIRDDVQAAQMRAALQTVYLDRFRNTYRRLQAVHASAPWDPWAAAVEGLRAADPWEGLFGG